MRQVLLAIDTSTRVIGLALYTQTQVLHEAVWSSHDHHTVELAPAVSNAMKVSGISAADLSAIGVAIGPGSFTGLRIGLALAKGMAMAQNLPLIGVPTLDILAAGIGGGLPTQHAEMVALLRAGRGRLAACWYQASHSKWQPVGEVEVMTAKEMCERDERWQNPTLVCGELTPDERKYLAENQANAVLASAAYSLRRPTFLAELAWERLQRGESDPPGALAPVYLHYKEPIPG
jgi:tRNA threonylcarbamoyladenosine biosynthesis protein TsaB